jgi:SAM-dependent methyltransferase
LNRFQGHHRIPLLRRLYDQRDQATSERDAAIAQRDRRASERDAAIAERDHLWSMLGNARPSISVYRDGEVFMLMVEDMDRFPFRNGDELSVEPSSQRDRCLRTPDGHVHIPVAPGVGVRVPPKINLFEFKGFSVPEHLINLTGAGIASFDGIGRAHIENYERIMRLFPDMTFLEIGSGAGRDAFQLLDLLGSEGRYVGIDVQRESIVWCQNNIGRQRPNFWFHHFNAYHELHNPIATKTTLDFRVPVPDASVDRVALGSVFTHIFADEVLHYLKELARVMKPEGLCYATFFLYSEEVVQASRQNNVTQYNLRFEHPYGEGCYINDLQYPTGAVAFTEEKMNAMIREAGLTLDRPFLKGFWSGFYVQGEAEDGQDVAVLRRT